ncbi:MAG: ABC transporter permease [Anaerolineales bacterium]|nr:ABC transporter permease [Anaerolineales bacterium]
MRPRWRKVLHDLFDNKARTLLVVFSIAVGVFSIGVIAGAYEIISNDMSASYAANQPSNVEFRMTNFDDDVLTSVRNAKTINEAEARRVFNVRVRVVGTEKWSTLDMVAFHDFAKNKVNLLLPLEGTGEPRKREVLLEQNTLKDFNVGVGGQLEFQLPDGSTKIMPVVGIVQDIAMGAGDFLASPHAYMTMNTLPYMQQPELYNRIYATVSESGDDILHVRAVGADLKDKLESGDAAVIRMRFALSHEHPMASTVNAILGILMALGILIVFLSSSLIANTLSALLSQHLRYIGVIKLVGGRNRQVFFMYLALIMCFGVLALLIAVPLGGQGAYGLALFISTMLNFNLLGYRIIPFAFLVQIAIGVLVPLVAGLLPVTSGARITVLRALSGDLSQDAKQASAGEENRFSRFDRMQLRFTHILTARGIHIPRPFIISLRNTFRRKRRLALTLFTLTMGGAIFIAVFNVRITLHDYIGAIGKYFTADVSVDFDYPYRLHEIEQTAMQMPGVLKVEGWQFTSSEILDENDNVLENINIFGPPAQSRLVEPILVAGRWMQVGDVRKLIVSEAVYKYYPNMQPGDTLRLKIDGRKEVWEVVGIFKFVDREGVLAYAPFEYMSKMNHLVNRSSSYRIALDKHDRSYQDAMAEKLDLFFRDNGFTVRSAKAGRASLDKAVESLDTLAVFLLIMALLTATVGAMGLAGTMGMNVMERTREIGIMRSIGADDRAVMRTVIAEGVVIGVISFALAIVLSVPFTYLLSTIVSLAVFQTPIDTIFTFTGYGIWLALVLILSALASILPARNAARLTIREVLAYE